MKVSDLEFVMISSLRLRMLDRGRGGGGSRGRGGRGHGSGGGRDRGGGGLRGGRGKWRCSCPSVESNQCEKEAGVEDVEPGVEDVEPEEVVGVEEEPLSRRVVLMILGFSSLVLVENNQISV